MKRDQIVKKIEKIPAGQFFRIRYMTKVKLTADAVQKGISILKIVNTTSRTGISYMSLIDPSDWKSLEDYEGINSNFTWICKNRIKYNHNTGKEYLVLAPVAKGHHTNSTYVMTTSDGVVDIVSEEEVRKHAVTSYWRYEKPKVINVTLDNILWM